jgi:hypothetical protein
MRRRPTGHGIAVAQLALLVSLSSCSDADLAGRILSVEAESAVVGLVYLDQNGNRLRDAADQAMEGLEIQLFVAGTRSLLGSAVTDANGIFIVEGVPVGRLRIEADTAFLGDSLAVFDLDEPELTLGATDTLALTFGVTFPSVTLAEARSLPEGTKAFIEGIVLNPRDPLGDGALHLQAGDTYLRVLGTQRTAALFPGDSVRILGRTAREVGQPVLRAEEPFLLAQQVVRPVPLELATATAASADGGQRDAALVRIRDAYIVDTATVTGSFGRDVHLTLDDGSGELDVVLGEFGGFDLRRVHPDSFSVRQATGLLVPSQTAEGIVWRLFPRSTSDLETQAIPFPARVTDLSVVDGTDTTLVLNWTEVDDGNGNPSSYAVQFRPVTTLAWTQIESGECGAPVAGTAIDEIAACTVEGLQPGTIYFFQVRSLRGTLGVDAEFGPWSNVAADVTTGG